MSEHARTELVVSDDLLLVAAVGSVVEHTANRAGLPEDAQRQLAHAAEQVCRESFPLLNGRDRLIKCAVEDFDDRIEVTLDYSGVLRPATAEQLTETVDRIVRETRGGRSRVTLVKYLRGTKN